MTEVVADLWSSTTKSSAVEGGITGGEPSLPYAHSCGQCSRRFSPGHMPRRPSSQQPMTAPVPRAKRKPALCFVLESNSFPLAANVPT